MAQVDTKHPQWMEAATDWELLRDTYAGERQVKERGFRYLPPTSGMRADGIRTTTQPGYQAYNAYRTRARVPDHVKGAVETMLGVMHAKPPVINLPESMGAMRERATLRGESLEALLRRINEEQLVAGRIGLLLEVAERTGNPGAPPLHVATYRAERGINWDEGTRDETVVDSLNLVVLDESEVERQPNSFEWELKEKYRVLWLGDVDENERVGGGTYTVATVDKAESLNAMEGVQPSVRGQTLDRIPFVFVNTKDVVPDIDVAPLLGLANNTISAYRQDADYKQSLFLQGQDTLVIIGTTSGASSEEGGEELRVGAGTTLELTQGSDAKYIGVESAGLGEQRLALEATLTRGEQISKGILESVSSGAESGEALRVRVSARTASLNQIALTGAFGLQELLRMAAVWIGANPEEVEVLPNLDFVDDRISGTEVAQLMTGKGLGAPLSLRSIHEGFQERGLTTRDFDEEKEEMAREFEEGLPGALPVGEPDIGTSNPTGPVDDGDGEPDPDPEPEDVAEGDEDETT